jgi:protein-disulfide isomerase
MAALHTTIDPCRRVCDILGQTAVASTVVFNNFKCKGLQHLKKTPAPFSDTYMDTGRIRVMFPYLNFILFSSNNT